MKITREIRILLEQTRIYWILYGYISFLALDVKSRRMVMPKNTSKPSVYLFLSADYGNLGDYAISFAQRMFLKNVYPNRNLVEVKMEQTALANIYSKQFQLDDIVTIIGGGNMGNLYYQYELNRQYVIRKFKSCKIISFPQSLFFTDDKKGKIIGDLMRKFYMKYHETMILLFREKQSLVRAQTIFLNDSMVLAPDIVLTLDGIKPSKRQNMALLCMRGDREASIDMGGVKKFLQEIYECGYVTKFVDTHVGKGLFDDQYLSERLENLLNQFRSSSFVVTDRLHGMIFAYITGTPAIVLPNNNGKIESSYRWIEDCEYITFCKDISEINISKWIADINRKDIDYDAFCQRRSNFIKLTKNACHINNNSRI